MKLMQKGIHVIPGLFLLTATSAYADSWNCSHNDLVREVVIEYPEGGTLPCQVIYKKQTEGFGDQTLWTANNEEGYCEQQARDFVARIESWGWVCMETVGSQGGEIMEMGGENMEMGGENMEMGGENMEMGGENMEMGGENVEMGGESTEMNEETSN